MELQPRMCVEPPPDVYLVLKIKSTLVSAVLNLPDARARLHLPPLSTTAARVSFATKETLQNLEPCVCPLVSLILYVALK